MTPVGLILWFAANLLLGWSVAEAKDRNERGRA
jgi:hypothetical protein